MVARARRPDAVAAAIYAGFVGAIGLGFAASLLVSYASGSGSGDGLRFCLYMLSATVAALILGLIFGVPRVREGAEAGDSERFTANSNLEQISDWLTKLLVGVGLVQLTKVPSYAASLGDYLGGGLQTPNAEAVSVAVVAYGIGIGFLAGYLWTRLQLRVLLERAERVAADASKAKSVEAKLRQQNEAHAQPESEQELRAAALSAVRRTSEGRGSIAPILWVDDVPSNNDSILQALRALDIDVELARTTSEGLEEHKRRSWGLIITDLGRVEPTEADPNHYNAHAGLELIEGIRASDNDTQVFVFGTHRALAEKKTLIDAGANLVTNRASVLYEQAVATVVAPTA